jgi:hypothetical protein
MSMNDPNNDAPPECNECKDEMTWSESYELHFCDRRDCAEYNAEMNVRWLEGELARMTKKFSGRTQELNSFHKEHKRLQQLADLVPELINRRNSDVIWWKVSSGKCIYCDIEHEWSQDTGPQRRCTNPTCPAVKARKLLKEVG